MACFCEEKEIKYVLPPGPMPLISHPHLLCFSLFQPKCLTLMLVTLHSFCLHSESPNAEQESDETYQEKGRTKTASLLQCVLESLFFFMSRSLDPGLGDASPKFTGHICGFP